MIPTGMVKIDSIGVKNCKILTIRSRNWIIWKAVDRMERVHQLLNLQTIQKEKVPNK